MNIIKKGILVFDLLILIAILVCFFVEPEPRAWVFLGILAATFLAYHIVSAFLMRWSLKIEKQRIPTPHGRLIDADALLKEATLMWDDPLELYDESVIPVSCVKNAPTIVKREDDK